MEKLTFKEWSILADLETIAPLGEDFEFSMARGELKTAKSAINRLMKHLNGEGDLEAWVQSKITKAAEYLDTVADHMDGGEDDTKRTKEVKEGFKGHKSVEEIAKKHDVSPSVIQKQLEMGMKVEHEHTTDNDQAMDIALQHLDEVPNYYSKLKKVEKVKEDWSEKYKKSINCDNPKGFSQRAHCQGRKKRMTEDMSPHEEATERSKEKLKKEKKITTAHMVMPRNAVYQPKPDPIKDTSVKEQPKPKAEEKKEPLTALQAAKLRKLEREQKKKKKKVSENVEILDAEGNLFATVIDIIKGSDYKFKSFTQPIEEKCWTGYKKKGMKTMFGKRYPNCVKKEEVEIEEANKSGDSSLHDWFTKSRASDGTPGWVQLGGKYAGKPCAKQPGQDTKPKCGSSKMKSDLSDKEEESAFRRKNEEDPNPDRKGKAKMVATEEKDACYTKVKSRYRVWPSAYASGALVKCRKVGAANWGNKTTKEDTDFGGLDDQDIPLKMDIHHEGMRYCPKCGKNETGSECKYGEKYWRMFSLPSSLAPDPYDPNDIHPANENVSFEIGSGHRQAQRQAKIRNLATGTTNKGEKDAAMRKLSGPSLPLADSVIQPGQLTNEDYQRIQSTGNMYTILFSWRGRPMMNLQLFFPNMKRPSKDEVKAQIEKLYPGAVIMQWYPSPTDPSKPIVVIQGK